MQVRKSLLVWAIISIIILIGFVLYFGFANKSLHTQMDEIEIENAVLVSQLSEVPPTPVFPTETPLPEQPTEMPQPSATLAPTLQPSPEATATMQKLTLLPDGFKAWCMPNDVSEPDIPVSKTGLMPQGAREMTVEEDEKTLLIQVRSCTFVYTFNQPVHNQVHFTMFDKSQFAFVDTYLTPVEDHPEMGMVTVTHDFVIDPPYWSIVYYLSLEDVDLSALFDDEVVFKRGWFPGVCYEGAYPDPVTLECPKIGEAHPWDPWFGWDDPKINPDEE